jgi:phosphohistidine phosphatase
MATGHLIMLLRHAIAEDPSPGRSDEERRLTGEGKRKLREIVAGMRALDLPVDAILTSPLRRSRETADLVAAGYDREDAVVECAALGPAGGPDAVLGALRGVRGTGVVLVGHEPDMGELASTLLTGSAGLVHLDFRKAGLCGIAVASLPPRGAGTLLFFLTPGQLRRLGRP